MQTERDTRPIPSWWWAAVPVLLTIVLWAFVAQHDPIDLKVYRMGGEFIWHRQTSLYDLKDFWLPFTYPPFAAVVFAPLALLPPQAMIVATYALSGAALIRISVLVLRRLQPNLAATIAILLTPMALLLDPIVSNFGFGQVNLLLAWLVVEDLMAPRSAAGGAWGSASPPVSSSPRPSSGCCCSPPGRSGRRSSPRCPVSAPSCSASWSCRTHR
ncbi:glycosyltransferase 87 family protein [Raineyella fluvialis]|uniref:glycosyltransferase 87 family protein n=1 Tax=Raineyella fluvialis TaxID=2662261 RepID=UPI001EEF8C34|nr:glycosyltransferase 87 family protein [Raineyella fluvialis]